MTIARFPQEKLKKNRRKAKERFFKVSDSSMLAQMAPDGALARQVSYQR